MLCVLLMLTLALQVLLAAAATAAMAAPEAILCMSAADGSHQPDSPDHHPECACGLLCQAGMSVAAALSPPSAGGVPIRFAARIEHVAETMTPSGGPRVEGRRQARAPPAAKLQD